MNMIIQAKTAGQPIGKWFKKIHSFITQQEETITLTEEKLLEIELECLRKDIQLKHENFANASGDYIDIAVYELNLTQQKYDVALRQLKKIRGIVRKPANN